MGTHALLKLSENGLTVVTIYIQWDGDFLGFGLRLAKFLNGFTIVNGIGMGLSQNTTKIANGAGCLFAQIIAHFKVGVGGVYITRTDGSEEEYNYTVDVTNNKLTFNAASDYGEFSGSCEKFIEDMEKIV